MSLERGLHVGFEPCLNPRTCTGISAIRAAGCGLLGKAQERIRALLQSVMHARLDGACAPASQLPSDVFGARRYYAPTTVLLLMSMDCSGSLDQALGMVPASQSWVSSVMHASPELAPVLPDTCSSLHMRRHLPASRLRLKLNAASLGQAVASSLGSVPVTELFAMSKVLMLLRLAHAAAGSVPARQCLVCKSYLRICCQLMHAVMPFLNMRSTTT